MKKKTCIYLGTETHAKVMQKLNFFSKHCAFFICFDLKFINKLDMWAVYGSNFILQSCTVITLCFRTQKNNYFGEK